MSNPQGQELPSSSPAPSKPTNANLREAITTRGTTQNDNNHTAWETAVPIPGLIVHSPTFSTEGSRTLPFLDTHLSPVAPKEPTSPSQKSPATSVEMEDLTDDILPHEVTVKVKISWLGKRDWEIMLPFREFPWIHKAKYEELVPTKIIQKSLEVYPDLKGKEVYHRHGSCRITASSELSTEMPYSFLDDGEVSTLIENAIPLICGFIHDHPRRKFSLKIYWECGYACLSPQLNTDGPGSQTYGQMIRTELKSKRQTNFRNKDYISRRDQSAFQQYDVVRNLVFHDNSLGLLDDDARQQFVNQIIQRPALKLLLNCVYHGFGLDLLHHLLDVHEASDLTLPTADPECKRRYCQYEEGCHLEQVLKIRAMFHVRNIEEDFQYHELDDGEVLPLLFTGQSNSEPELFGDGASSMVYKVRIDSAHHYLSGVS
jgi:hypothetical protein